MNFRKYALLIAYRARENNRIIFSSCELKSYGIDVHTISGMGLLLIVPSTSVYGREKSYNFLHLTLQEFQVVLHITVLHCLHMNNTNALINTSSRMSFKLYGGFIKVLQS